MACLSSFAIRSENQSFRGGFLKAIAGVLDRSESMSPDHQRSLLESMVSKEGALSGITSQFWSDPLAFVALAGASDLDAIGAPEVLYSPSNRYVGLIYGLLGKKEDQNAFNVESNLFGGFSGARPEERLMQSLDDQGIGETLKQLNGAFALALWDRQDKALSLACDRMGEETMYYSVMAGRLVFSTCLASLMRSHEFKGEIDRDALTLFLRYGFYPAPFTVFKNVKKLMAGTYVTFGIKHWDEPPCTYWSFGDELTSAQYRDAPSAGNDFMTRVHALKSAMLSKLKESGGAPAFIDAEGLFMGSQAHFFNEDERALLSCISMENLIKVEATAEEADDLGFDTEYLNRILAIASHSEPLADSTAILCGLIDAKLGPKLGGLVIGDGPSIWCGIESKDILRKWSMFARVPLAFRKIVGSAVTILPPSFWSKSLWYLRLILPRKIALSRFGERLSLLRAQLFSASFEDFLLCRRSIWFEPERVVRQSIEPHVGLRNVAHWLRLRHLGQRVSFYDYQTISSGRLLAWAGLAHHRSILIAKPFMVPEVALSLIVEQNDSEGGDSAAMLSELGLNRVHSVDPNELMDRVGDWLRGPLKEWAHGLLNDRQLKSDRLFNRGLIRRKWLQHQAGNNDSVRELWAVLVFMAWLEEHRASISMI